MVAIGNWLHSTYRIDDTNYEYACDVCMCVFAFVFVKENDFSIQRHRVY